MLCFACQELGFISNVEFQFFGNVLSEKITPKHYLNKTLGMIS